MIGATTASLSASRDLGRTLVTLVPCAGTANCLSFVPVGLFDDAALVVLAEAPGSTAERPLRRRLSSGDGGSTWTAVDCALPRFLNSMVLFPGKTSHGWAQEPVVDATGRSTRRWRSGDSGCTWTPAPAEDSRFEAPFENALDAGATRIELDLDELHFLAVDAEIDLVGAALAAIARQSDERETGVPRGHVGEDGRAFVAAAVNDHPHRTPALTCRRHRLAHQGGEVHALGLQCAVALGQALRGDFGLERLDLLVGLLDEPLVHRGLVTHGR